ncbi:MAG TPA: hypothetical protein DCF68_06765 [Cyanothece sp. UBA12306]|nr:hypothetical protein [Cyanothece sp. UBA12306]
MWEIWTSVFASNFQGDEQMFSPPAKLNFLWQQYDNFLRELETTTSPCSEQVLKVLLLRDRIQEKIKLIDNRSTSIIHKLTDYDQRLRNKKDYIVTLKEYHQWKEIVPFSPDSWWWNWESPSAQNFWQKSDWLWNGLTLICLGISLSLIIDAVPRILSGGIDQLSALSIIIPTFLTLLTNSKLTPIGQKIRNYFEQKNNLFADKYNFISSFISLVLVIILVFIHENFGLIGTHFNQQGLQHYQNNQFEQALSNYNNSKN